MPFINFQTPEDRRWQKLETGLGGLLDKLGGKITQNTLKKQRAQALEALMPGLGNKLINLSSAERLPFLKEKAGGPRYQAEGELLNRYINQQPGEESIIPPELFQGGAALKNIMPALNLIEQKKARQEKAMSTRQKQLGDVFYRQYEASAQPAQAANKVNYLVKEALDIIKKGVPTLGPKALFTADLWDTPEGQHLDKILNSLVIEKAAATGGAKTSAKLIELQKSAKARRTMKAQALIDSLKDEALDPTILETRARAAAGKKLTSDWEGNIPNNFSKQWNTLTEDLSKEYRDEFTDYLSSIEKARGEGTFDSLQEAYAQVPVGTFIVDGDTVYEKTESGLKKRPDKIAPKES